MARSLVFFVLFYAYFVREIDVRLLYHCCGLIDNFPSFYGGWDFFRGFLSHPGGIVEYLAALLAQSFYYSWLGAAVVTAQAWAICWCTEDAIKTLGVPHLRGLRFLGPLVLLAVYSQYGLPFLTTTALLVALSGLCLYLRLAQRTPARAVGSFLAIGTIMYIAAGGAALLFALLCGLYELLLARRPALGLAQLASGAAIPYVFGVLAYGIRTTDAYARLLPLSWEVTRRSTSQIMLEAVYTLYLFLPLTVALLGTWRLVVRRPDKPASSRLRAARGARPSSKRGAIGAAARAFADQSHGAFGWNLQTLALVGVTAVTLLLYRNPARRDLFRADYFSRHGMWAQSLEIGRHGPYRYFVCHAVDRALCHTDRLGDDMFCFPQHPEALFLTKAGTDPLWQKFDTCMDLGLINQAENALTLCLEVFGERPLLLHRLATVNMIKGNVETARVFLRALEKVPFWQSTARKDLARLASDPGLLEDKEIQQWRSVMLKTDYVTDVDTLTLLLTENPRNRMAYQYGMASLLLSKNLDDFARTFHTYHRRNFSRIPRHYAEALLLSRALRGEPLEVPGQTIAAETQTQLREFLHLFRQGGRDRAATQSTLKERFGTTYYYYYYFFSS